MKILVIRLSSMGDVICATPLFSFLVAKYPSASITFVTEQTYSALFTDDPRLAEVIGVGRPPPAQSPVSSRSWDLVVDLQNSGRSRALLGRVRKRTSVGYFDKLHLQRFALLFLRLNGYDPRWNVVARAIRAAGGSVAPEMLPPPRLFFREASCGKATAQFHRQTGGIMRPSIALFPFSAWENKEWPERNFVNTGRYFLTKGWNVAILGGDEDAKRADRMKELIGARCVSLAGKLDLYETGCLLTGFALALGNDTGLSHLARASGVKTGVLYGPTTHHFGFYPYGQPPFKIFEHPLFCRPCHAHGGDICLRVNRPCLNRIDFHRVINGLEDLARMK